MRSSMQFWGGATDVLLKFPQKTLKSIKTQNVKKLELT